VAEVKYSAVREIPELAITKVNFGHISLAYHRQRLHAKPRTAKTKRISELSYSGRKLHRQKGTGFARQGERGNPHMRGGAVPMGPLPLKREIKLNKKVRRSALLSAIKFHLDNGAIKLLKSKEFENFTKTRDAYRALVESGFTGRGIVVIPEDAQVERALRNIAGITTLHPRELNVGDLVESNFIIFTENAFKSFREFLRSLPPIRKKADGDDGKAEVKSEAEEAKADDKSERSDKGDGAKVKSGTRKKAKTSSQARTSESKGTRAKLGSEEEAGGEDDEQ